MLNVSPSPSGGECPSSQNSEIGVLDGELGPAPFNRTPLFVPLKF